jgi:hypothetical protein
MRASLAAAFAGGSGLREVRRGGLQAVVGRVQSCSTHLSGGRREAEVEAGAPCQGTKWRVVQMDK